MANHISHASLPYPIKNARFTIEVPYLDADGDPTDPTTPDTEVSQDGGAFADAAEEVTTISGSNGAGYITLTGAETNNSSVVVAFKVASGPKNTLGIFKPRVLAVVGSGTLSAGSAGGGTLGTLLAYDVTGCFIRTTGGTGGGGTGGASNQARKIITYNTSTGAFTVAPNWETTPSTDTTYDVLLPEGVTLGMLKALNPTTPGYTLDVTSTGAAGIDWGNVENKTTTNALTGTTVATTQKVDVETIKTQTVTCSAGVTVSPYVGSTGAAINGTNANTLSGHDPGTTIGTSTLTQTQITGGAYALNSSSFAFNAGLDFTTTQKAATLARVTLTDTVTTYTGNTPQTGDSYAIVNSGTHGNAAIKGYVDDIGTAGAGLTAIPWNAAWDAEVQSEVQDAIEANNLDHLVKIGVDTDFATTVHLNSVVGHLADNGTSATFDRTTDALEAIRDRGDSAWITATGFSTLNALDIRNAVGLASANLDTQLDALPTNAELATALGTADDAVLSAIAALNNLSAAQVNSEVDTALADIHLDHLLAATYDPASKPGAADALLNELIGNDGGVSQFTANALELAPTGGSAPSASAIADEVQTRTIAAVTVVNGLANNVITAASIASDALTAAKIADGAIDAATFAADVDAEILSYIVDDATRIDASALNTATVTTIPEIDTTVTQLKHATIIASGEVVTGTSTTQFTTNITFITDAYVDALIGFSTGTLAGQYRPIVSMNSGTGVITVSEAFTGTPSTGDDVWIAVSHIHPISQIQSGLATQTSVDDLPTNAELATALGTADDAVLSAIAAEAIKTSAIKAKTDNLPSDPADQSAVEAAITAATSGLATASSLSTVSTNVSAIQTILSGITSLGNWLRRIVRKDAGTAGMATAASEIGTGGTSTFDGTTDSLEAIRDSGAGGLDAAGVRAAIGMAAANLDTQLGTILAAASAGAGSGARTVTITVNDGTDPLENAIVRLTEGASTYTAETNASGVATFNVDDATYTVSITKVGYTYAGTTLVVNGTETETYSMTAIGITPGTGNLTTGYLTVLDESGDPESGVTVRIQMARVPTDDTGYVYDPTIKSDTSDGDGLVEFTMVKGASYYIWEGSSTRPQSTRLITVSAAAGSTYALPSLIGE